MAAGDAILMDNDQLEDLTGAQRLALRNFVVSLGLGNPDDIRSILCERRGDGKIRVEVRTRREKAWANLTADEVLRVVAKA